jgi:hypothetical protein
MMKGTTQKIISNQWRNSMFRKFTNVFLFLLLLSISTYGQTPVNVTLKPYGVTPYMVALSTTDMYDFTYTGLQNVGVGTKVFLQAAVTGKKFATVTYTFTRKPLGATAAISATKDIQTDSTQVVSFTADLPGTYAIMVSDGIYSSTEVVINAAKYLGYKNTVVNGVDTKTSCGTCHADKVAGWEETNHSSLFSRAMVATPGISGPADHYSTSCIKCHTTGYDANPTAKNDGFDDLGFVYPTVITPTTLAELTVKYPAAILRGNIQCESCHGPASAHLGNTSDNRITVTFEPDVCAYCHESGTNHIIAREFRAAAHATNTLNGEEVNESGAGREACVRCHTGKGFVQFVNGVSTTDPYFDPSFYPITCAGCHDPHGKDNVKQLRTLTATLVYPAGTTPATATTIEVKEAGLGTICFNCHQSRTEAKTALAGVGTSSISSRFGPHYGAQGDILYSNNMLELGGVKLAKSNHMGAAVDACVRCHMYNLNRVVNGKLIQAGGHSFAVREPHPVDAGGHILKDAVGDLVKGKADMEICAQCHGTSLGLDFEDVKFFFNGNGDHDNNGVVEGLQKEVKGMIIKIMSNLRTAIPAAVISTSYGYNTETGWFGFPTPSKTWTTAQLSAYWNAFTANEDKSGGIHNPKYVVSALRGAMASLGIATAVEKEESVPTAYTLYQNYPNPFNPTTNIKFALPNSGHVRLTIYDALGREVETLVNNELVAGTHNIEWTAKNMASGIYLYRIEAGNFVKVSKMLLVK